MNCPEGELLSRIIAGRNVAREDEVQAHIAECPRCQARMREEDELGCALRSFFKNGSDHLIRDGITCPSPPEIAAYVEGRVEIYRKKQLLQHFCICSRCSRAVLDTSRAREGRQPAPPESILKEARAVYKKN